jgi:uncharacterized membrane protein
MAFSAFSRRLIVIAIVLTVLSAARRSLDSLFDLSRDSWAFQATRFLDVVVDGTLPTWYSSVLLLIAAALVLHVLRLRREQDAASRRIPYLVGLAVGLVLMSIDETAEIHEQFTPLVHDTVTVNSAALQYAWVVVAIPMVLVVALVYRRWVLTLPRSVRNLVLAGGAVFVAGAVGLEIVSAQLEFGANATQTAAVVSHGEELAEMLGVIFFIEAMMRYLTDVFGWDGVLRFAVGTPRTAEATLAAASDRTVARPAWHDTS